MAIPLSPFLFFCLNLSRKPKIKRFNQIKVVGGKEKFQPELKTLPNVSGYSLVTSIGIIRDADNDPKAAFDSVRSALINSGLPQPNKPLEPLF